MQKFSHNVATNASELTKRAEAECVKRGHKADDYAAMHEATKIVLSRDPRFAKAYFADPCGLVAGSQEDDE